MFRARLRHPSAARGSDGAVVSQLRIGECIPEQGGP